MKRLDQPNSDQSLILESRLCPKGHSLNINDEICVECFNQIIGRVPSHLMGIGAFSSLLTIAGEDAVLVVIPATLAVPSSTFVVALSMAFALIGLVNAVIFKLSIAKLQPLSMRTKKPAYQRHFYCSKCGAPLKDEECSICARRRRSRSDAIGIIWITPVFYGSFVLFGSIALAGFWAILFVFLGAVFPYAVYAYSLSRRISLL